MFIHAEPLKPGDVCSVSSDVDGLAYERARKLRSLTQLTLPEAASSCQLSGSWEGNSSEFCSEFWLRRYRYFFSVYSNPRRVALRSGVNSTPSSPSSTHLGEETSPVSPTVSHAFVSTSRFICVQPSEQTRSISIGILAFPSADR